jgi:hypothetical protein
MAWFNPLSWFSGAGGTRTTDNPGPGGAQYRDPTRPRGDAGINSDRIRKPEAASPAAPLGTPGLTDEEIAIQKNRAEEELRRKAAGQGRAANILAGANPNIMEVPSARRTLLGVQ